MAHELERCFVIGDWRVWHLGFAAAVRGLHYIAMETRIGVRNQTSPHIAPVGLGPPPVRVQYAG